MPTDFLQFHAAHARDVGPTRADTPPPAAAPMALLDLPQDLIRRVTDELHEPHDLASFVTVSPAFRAHATSESMTDGRFRAPVLADRVLRATRPTLSALSALGERVMHVSPTLQRRAIADSSSTTHHYTRIVELVRLLDLLPSLHPQVRDEALKTVTDIPSDRARAAALASCGRREAHLSPTGRALFEAAVQGFPVATFAQREASMFLLSGLAESVVREDSLRISAALKSAQLVYSDELLRYSPAWVDLVRTLATRVSLVDPATLRQIRLLIHHVDDAAARADIYHAMGSQLALLGDDILPELMDIAAMKPELQSVALPAAIAAWPYVANPNNRAQLLGLTLDRHANADFSPFVLALHEAAKDLHTRELAMFVAALDWNLHPAINMNHAHLLAALAPSLRHAPPVVNNDGLGAALRDMDLASKNAIVVRTLALANVADHDHAIRALTLEFDALPEADQSLLLHRIFSVNDRRRLATLYEPLGRVWAHLSRSRRQRVLAAACALQGTFGDAPLVGRLMTVEHSSANRDRLLASALAVPDEATRAGLMSLALQTPPRLPRAQREGGLPTRIHTVLRALRQLESVQAKGHVLSTLMTVAPELSSSEWQDVLTHFPPNGQPPKLVPERAADGGSLKRTKHA